MLALHQVGGQLECCRLEVRMAELLSVELGVHPLLKVDRSEVLVVDVAECVEPCLVNFLQTCEEGVVVLGTVNHL